MGRAVGKSIADLSSEGASSGLQPFVKVPVFWSARM